VRGADGHNLPAVGYGSESIPALSLHVPLSEASFSLVPLSKLVGDLPGSTPSTMYMAHTDCPACKPPCIHHVPKSSVLALRVGGPHVQVTVACVEVGAGSNVQSFLEAFESARGAAPVAHDPAWRAEYDAWFLKMLQSACRADSPEPLVCIEPARSHCHSRSAGGVCLRIRVPTLNASLPSPSLRPLPFPSSETGTMAGASAGNSAPVPKRMQRKPNEPPRTFLKEVGPLVAGHRLGFVEDKGGWLASSEHLSCVIGTNGEIAFSSQQLALSAQLNAGDVVASINGVRMPAKKKDRKVFAEQVAASPPGVMQVWTRTPHYQPNAILNVRVPSDAVGKLGLAGTPPTVQSAGAAAAAHKVLQGDILVQWAVDGGEARSAAELSAEQLMVEVGKASSSQPQGMPQGSVRLVLLQPARTPAVAGRTLPWDRFHARNLARKASEVRYVPSQWQGVQGEAPSKAPQGASAGGGGAGASESSSSPVPLYGEGRSLGIPQPPPRED
jgi:hypothetical protein